MSQITSTEGWYWRSLLTQPTGPTVASMPSGLTAVASESATLPAGAAAAAVLLSAGAVTAHPATRYD